jgi:hypothetical protein
MIGIYKDHRSGFQNNFYIPFLLIALSFVIERQAINWLFNRNGCDFNIFQKMIEIELRIKQIEQDEKDNN